MKPRIPSPRVLLRCSSLHARTTLARVVPRAIPRRSLSSSSSSLPATHNTPLHQLFDVPLNSYASSPTYSSNPTGLFLQPVLTTPSSFPVLAHRTTLRAQILVQRICDPSTYAQTTVQDLAQAEHAFLAMVKDLDRLSDLLCGVIDLAELVRNVHPQEEWRSEANEAYEGLYAYMNELNTHVGLYQGLKSLHSLLPATTPQKSPELFAAYAVATPFLRDFEKSGIHLPSLQRTKFVDLSTEILQLGRKFLINAGEPREGVQVGFKEVEEGFGNAFARRIFGEEAQGNAVGFVDPISWEGRVLARQHPSSELRKRLYLATHRAPDQSHLETLDNLLIKRGELARLVGRDSWGQTVLEDKMAQDPENVMGFLDALDAHNRPLAQKDLKRLQDLKRQIEGGEGRIDAWDRDFYSDLVNQRPSPIPDLAPFFSVGSCFSGLSKLFERIYGIRFEPEEMRQGEGWDPSVRKLRVVDDQEGEIGTIYCDLFAREGKQPGAAHYTVRCSRRVDDDRRDVDFGGREFVDLLAGERVYKAQAEEGLLDVPTVEWNGREGRYQPPIVVLVCAFGMEGEWQKATRTCLQWHEVETLFHEMGHAIHCEFSIRGRAWYLSAEEITHRSLEMMSMFTAMIGRTSYHNVSGTRCATDFVEFPSILMEHFITSPSVLDLFAHHPASGRPIPRSILNQMLVDRSTFSALETTSQIMMAALDQRYHSGIVKAGFSSRDELATVMKRYHVLPPPSDAQADWHLTFGHLFGYGATYYSYLFDRAIAAKVFGQKFAEDPLNRENGEELKKSVLRWGGGKEPWEMIGELVGEEEVMRGGKRGMVEVGRWGIEEAKQGK
ncbi:BZ3500_MvSof-1268-A1-R1_Chr12-1g03646 [Microbotryum saponariae]|uniref:mitochondrial intermediate peptidase n=1 Tax=Microbotryum saponariae TaxID=289078 RepID=A0A2X0KM71_9BASI|nr:BZ3500_MvSof-1268-A1-R1_Chr12-1g03646 [Microbotryum saponariae]SDA05239.1 BZ3501_MvSof-1269-A2-R1_Chr12-1g03223 [Microbotryum saponariae]